MTTPFILLKISAIATSALLLTACIENDDSSDHDHGDHHDHAHSLMISQSNSTALSVLEEGAPEVLETAAAAVNADLLLSNSGEAAAVITAGSVQFVMAHHEEEEGEEEAHDEEEHELPEVSALQIDGAGIQVANTNGHFSVLANGTTQFVPYEALEDEIPETETPLNINESYPALLLDEGTDHSLVLAFTGGNAVVYEVSEASAEAGESRACATVNSTAHVGEFAVVSCTNGATSSTFSVKVEENTTTTNEHEAEIVTIAGINTAVKWKSRAGVFVGLGADDKFYVLEEENEALVLEGTAFTVDNMCDDLWGIDSKNADLFVIADADSAASKALKVFNHEGDEVVSLTLDLSPNATCEDLTMATATQAVFVLDNSAAKLYEIDKEEGAALYHVHGREDLSAENVASAVNFHEVGAEAGHVH